LKVVDATDSSIESREDAICALGANPAMTSVTPVCTEADLTKLPGEAIEACLIRITPDFVVAYLLITTFSPLWRRMYGLLR